MEGGLTGAFNLFTTGTAAALGIQKGGTYPMDIFHAERRSTDSTFRIETTIPCFDPIG